MGIEVLDVSESRIPTLSQAILRDSVYIALNTATLVYLFVVVWYTLFRGGSRVKFRLYLFQIAGLLAATAFSCPAAPAERIDVAHPPAPLVSAVETLTREWFRGQTADLAPDERPGKA